MNGESETKAMDPNQGGTIAFFTAEVYGFRGRLYIKLLTRFHDMTGGD
ncbi:hypothetical protein [Paludifilum halophilum]|nr:hypothetical protein [Paludifilum halophilum]